MKQARPFPTFLLLAQAVHIVRSVSQLPPPPSTWSIPRYLEYSDETASLCHIVNHTFLCAVSAPIAVIVCPPPHKTASSTEPSTTSGTWSSLNVCFRNKIMKIKNYNLTIIHINRLYTYRRISSLNYEHNAHTHIHTPLCLDFDRQQKVI